MRALNALGCRDIDRDDILAGWGLAPRTMSAEDAESAAEAHAEAARNQLMFGIRNWHKANGN